MTHFRIIMMMSHHHHHLLLFRRMIIIMMTAIAPLTFTIFFTSVENESILLSLSPLELLSPAFMSSSSSSSSVSSTNSFTNSSSSSLNSLSLLLSSSYEVDSFIHEISYRKLKQPINRNHTTNTATAKVTTAKVTTSKAMNANQKRRTTITKKNINNNNNNSSSLPHLIIHLGPPKTETTTIQYFLSQWFVDGTLRKDRYTYLGNYVYNRTAHHHNHNNTTTNKNNHMINNNNNTSNNNNNGPTHNEALNAKRSLHVKILHRLRDLECHHQMNQIRRLYERRYGISSDHHQYQQEQQHRPRLRLTLSQALLTQSKCARDIVSSFQSYSHQIINLIYFDETLSRSNGTDGHNVTVGYQYYYDDNDINHNNSLSSHPTIFDWISLYSLLQEYYQISVFVTYRRYYEWLPVTIRQISTGTLFGSSTYYGNMAISDDDDDNFFC